MGTLDEEWLVGGECVEGGGEKKVVGKETGRVLARPNGYQFWCEKAVEGVSDGLVGGTRLASERGTEMD